MSETPSSAVTAARAVIRSSSEDHAGIVADPQMAIGAADLLVGTDLELDHAEARALDDAPLDLVVRPRGLVEVTLPVDAPLYAADGIEDWSGAVHDAARLAGFGAPGLDLVFDGAGGGVHLAADHLPFAAAAQVAVPDTAHADPLVDLGSLAGDPAAFLPAVLDAPVHVDVAVDEAARVDLEAPDVRAPELSWLAAINGDGLHVGEAWAWSDVKVGYVFDHYV